MDEQLNLDLREVVPEDDEEQTASLSGDQLRDIEDEFSSFEDLHFSKSEGG